METASPNEAKPPLPFSHFHFFIAQQGQLHSFISPVGRLHSKNVFCLDDKRRFLVRSGGLEPPWLPIRPSNVRVCLFRHDRKNIQTTSNILKGNDFFVKYYLLLFPQKI